MRNDIKKQLYEQCLTVIKQRMENARQTIALADEGAEGETKSSAGDKYETALEMMMQEKDRGVAQLNEANKMLVALNRISINGQAVKVEEGSVVKTSNGNFYIAISAGVLRVGGDSFFAISPASPIGVKMMGIKVGDQFGLNGKNYLVNEIV